MLALLTDSALLLELDAPSGFLHLFESPGFDADIDAHRLRIPRSVLPRRTVFSLGHKLKAAADGQPANPRDRSLELARTLVCGSTQGLKDVLGPMAVVITNQWLADALELNPAFDARLEHLFGPRDGRDIMHALGQVLWQPGEELSSDLHTLRQRSIGTGGAGGSASGACVGLHLRRLHYDAAVTAGGEQVFLDCAADQARDVPAPRSLVFATDDPSLASWAVSSARRAQPGSSFADVVVPSLSVPAPPPVQPGDVAGAAAGTTALGDLRSALVDMFAIGMCERLVLTSWSTFSYVAHALSPLQGHAALVTQRCDSCDAPGPGGTWDERAHWRVGANDSRGDGEVFRYNGVPFMSSSRDTCAFMNVDTRAPPPCFHHAGFLSEADVWQRCSVGEDRLQRLFGRYC